MHGKIRAAARLPRRRPRAKRSHYGLAVGIEASDGMAVDAFKVAMRANSTGALSSAALVSISEAVSTAGMLWSAFGTTLPRWAIAALLGCGLRVTLNNRHHVTFRFSTDSFGTDPVIDCDAFHGDVS